MPSSLSQSSSLSSLFSLCQGQLEEAVLAQEFPVLEERLGTGPPILRGGWGKCLSGASGQERLAGDGVAPCVASPSTLWSIVHTQQCFLPLLCLRAACSISGLSGLTHQCCGFQCWVFIISVSDCIDLPPHSSLPCTIWCSSVLSKHL